ncbi:MAG: condensation domain-containing protein, partial [Pyrinomonadaceae bacterium]
FFDFGPDSPGRLLVVVHHLAVDGVSWRILLEDLQTAYARLERGERPELPAKTTSFKQWAERLNQYARSEELRAGLTYWLDDARARVAPLPVDYRNGAGGNTEASARTVSVSLDGEETRALLQEVHEAYRTRINDVLLAALAQSFAAWTGSRNLLIDLEGHGREEIGGGLDVSRTVGWFTSVFPVRLDLEGAASPGEALKSVKEQLRRVPDKGIGYGLLRYLGGDPSVAEKLRALPPAEILFNYLGQFDQVWPESSPFGPANESAGPAHGPRNARSHLLEIDAKVIGGRLRIDWSFSENVHRRATVETLARGFRDALRSFISHCLSPEAGGRTPSDFPLARLDQRTLDRLLEGRRVVDVYPLSPMQGLFYTFGQAQSEVGFEQSCYTLRGRLDVPAFKRAWARVVERHPVLRTAFVSEGLGEPLQLVHERVELPWEEQDWRSLSLAGQEERLKYFMREDVGRGFDLSEAPLLRLSLLRVADDTYQFVWSHHHLQIDGWSWPLVFKEVSDFYEAFRRGEDIQLEPGRPYRDYVAWLGAQEDTSAAEVFWREELRGFAAPTTLAAGRALQSTDDDAEQDGELQLRLSAETTAALRALAREHQLTLNTIVQGAWALLLGGYSGRRDVVFGAAVAGRPAELAGVESMIGLFINNLPVRVRISPDDSLLGWLKRLQSRQAELRQFEHTPLSQIQEWSEVPGRLRLFESLVVFQNYVWDDASRRRLGASVEITNIHSPVRTNYPLTLMAVPDRELLLRIIYH